MSDELKNIIFNISKEESDAIANSKKDWNEDFFPTSPKTVLHKVLIMVIATIVLCGIVYSMSDHTDKKKLADSDESEPTSYFSTDD